MLARTSDDVLEALVVETLQLWVSFAIVDGWVKGHEQFNALNGDLVALVGNGVRGFGGHVVSPWI